MLSEIERALLGDREAQEAVTARGELLPCAFCKCEEVKFNYACGEYWIECAECGAGCGFENRLREAANRWNHRPPLLTPTQMVLLEEEEK